MATTGVNKRKRGRGGEAGSQINHTRSVSREQEKEGERGRKSSACKFREST